MKRVLFGACAALACLALLATGVFAGDEAKTGKETKTVKETKTTKEADTDKPKMEAADDLWTTDFEAAKAKAKAEKKLLLVDFTGSDWCGWCIKLKKEVFDTELFKKEAPKQFVLVELDFPRGKELPEKVKKQNDELQEKYSISGFPTILILDPAGEVIAKTGYRAGGPEGYVKHLDEFQKLHAAVVDLKKKVDQSKGLDRAKLLDQLIDATMKLNDESPAILAWRKEILDLDPENKAGLKAKHQFFVLLTEAENLKQQRKLAESKAAYEKAAELPGATGEQKQDAYFGEGECFFMEKDFAGLVQCLEKAVKAAPESDKGKQLKSMLTRFEGLAKAQAKVVQLKKDLEKAKGLDRAKLLDELIDAQTVYAEASRDPSAAKDIEKWTKEILDLDPENKAGLKGKHQIRTANAEAMALVQSGKRDEALAVLDKAVSAEGAAGEQLQRAQSLRSLLLSAKGDYREAADALKKAIDAAPDGAAAAQLRARLTALEKRLEAEKDKKTEKTPEKKTRKTVETKTTEAKTAE